MRMQDPQGTRRILTAAMLVLLLVLGGLLANRMPGASQVEANTTTIISQAPRPVAILAGSCEAPGDVAWPLNDLGSPTGAVTGSVDADRTEYSFTANVPFTIAELVASEHAVRVLESATLLDTTLACGNIGGVPDGVGTLVVGLRWQVGLDISGIAVLSPSPADATRTLISVFITGSALGSVADAPQPAPTDDDIEPTEENVVPTDVAAEPTEVEAEPTEVEVEPTEVEAEPTEDNHGGGDDNGGGGGGDDNGGGGGDDNSGGGGDNSGGGHGGDTNGGDSGKGGGD